MVAIMAELLVETIESRELQQTLYYSRELYFVVKANIILDYCRTSENYGTEELITLTE